MLRKPQFTLTENKNMEKNVFYICSIYFRENFYKFRLYLYTSFSYVICIIDILHNLSANIDLLDTKKINEKIVAALAIVLLIGLLIKSALSTIDYKTKISFTIRI